MVIERWRAVNALCAAYRNASKQMLTSEDLEVGHRAGVRDVAVRLGVYDQFCKALNASSNASSESGEQDT